MLKKSIAHSVLKTGGLQLPDLVFWTYIQEKNSNIHVKQESIPA